MVVVVTWWCIRFNSIVMKVVKKVVASKSVGGLRMFAPLIVRFLDVLKHRLKSL